VRARRLGPGFAWRGLAALGLALALGSLAPGAQAQSRGESPGLYGETDGALTLGLAGGAGITSGGRGPVALGQLDLFFLSSAGIKIGYQHHDQSVGPGVELGRHALTVDVDLRPLFLFLAFTNRFTGRETLDLWLYSFGLEIGFSYERFTLSAPGLDDPSALGFHVGTGFEVPLWRRGGEGLYLRWQLRLQFVREVRFHPDLAARLGQDRLGLDAVQVGLLLRYRFQFWKDL
jgi:hypothetical protein